MDGTQSLTQVDDKKDEEEQEQEEKRENEENEEEEEKEEKEEGESFGRRILFVFNGICTCVQPCANPDIL